MRTECCGEWLESTTCAFCGSDDAQEIDPTYCKVCREYKGVLRRCRLCGKTYDPYTGDSWGHSYDTEPDHA